MTPKACPFCGSHDVKTLPGSSLRFMVAECQGCGAQGPEVRIHDATDPSDKWHKETLARLQAMAEWSYRIGGAE
jgi:transcription elongation factor Elf1